MRYQKFLAGLAAGLLCCVQSFANHAEASLPPDAPKDVKHILGFYYGNGENILIRENGGRLELLYRYAQDDKSFAASNIYSLHKEHFDAYTLNEAGPMTSSESSVRFERDADGFGISCRVGGHIYSRYFLGNTQGERAKIFRFPAHSAEEWARLRADAEAAAMPESLATGRVAQLVDAAALANIKINSVYATEDNCFGAPLYKNSQLYVGKETAAALEKVAQRLAEYGYGLVLWDAYRPWSASKLAHLALPAEQKYMLDDPDAKGSAHNTGCAVDVSLYNLGTGEEVEMICGFDEPSFRQYASYAGGTSRQRYLRAFLRETMEHFGFRGLEMEWWHFDFQPEEKWAHLNRQL